jgi:hypothetical protein
MTIAYNTINLGQIISTQELSRQPPRRPWPAAGPCHPGSCPPGLFFRCEYPPPSQASPALSPIGQRVRRPWRPTLLLVTNSSVMLTDSAVDLSSTPGCPETCGSGPRRCLPVPFFEANRVCQRVADLSARVANSLATLSAIGGSSSSFCQLANVLRGMPVWRAVPPPWRIFSPARRIDSPAHRGMAVAGVLSAMPTRSHEGYPSGGRSGPSFFGDGYWPPLQEHGAAAITATISGARDRPFTSAGEDAALVLALASGCRKLNKT